MAKSKRGKPSNFVIRIRALPADATPLAKTGDTELYAGDDGNIFAVRTEQVVYRLLGPIGGFSMPPAIRARRKADG